MGAQDDLGSDRGYRPGTKPKPTFLNDQGLAEWLRQYVQLQPIQESTGTVQLRFQGCYPSRARYVPPPRAVIQLRSLLCVWDLRLINSRFRPVWQIWVWNCGLSVSEPETQTNQFWHWQHFPSFRIKFWWFLGATHGGFLPAFLSSKQAEVRCDLKLHWTTRRTSRNQQSRHHPPSTKDPKIEGRGARGGFISLSEC